MLRHVVSGVIASGCLTFSSEAAGLKVVDRSEWDDSKCSIPDALKQPVVTRLITIHQTETANSSDATVEQEKAVLRSILKAHTTTERTNNEKVIWSDIAYHYVVGPSGAVYRCRDQKYQADSATILRSELGGNITVCLMGDFRTKKEKQQDRMPITPDCRPTDAAMASMASLVAVELARNFLGIENIRSHRDLNMIAGGSDSPGGLLYPKIKSKILLLVEAKLAFLREKKSRRIRFRP